MMPVPGVVLNSAGMPEPSPETVRRLKQVHPGLSLRYVPGADDRVWMITMEWQNGDPRWEMVQRQELAPNASFDIIGYLPLGCSADEAAPYVERSLRTAVHEDVRNLTSRMLQYNATATRSVTDAALNDVFTGGNPTEERVTGKRVRHSARKE